MTPQDAQRLARRFIELPAAKRPLFLEALARENVDFSLFPIPAEVAVDARDGLSFAQQRMWFLWRLDPASAAYHLPMAVRLEGAVDVLALQAALDALVQRHESLRTGFVEDGDNVRQVVQAACHVPLAQIELSATGQSLEALAEAQVREPFDLARPPLLRASLVKLAADEHVLLMTLHHIVADGWSMNVLVEEMVRGYDAACSGTSQAPAPLPIQYRDYGLWQRSWLEAGGADTQLAYWRERLGEASLPLNLPLDRPRPATPSFMGGRVEVVVEADLAGRLQRLAQAHQCTLFMVLLAAYKCLLQREGGQRHVRVGIPVANRQRAEVEPLIGCFINTQVLQTDIDPAIDSGALLARVRETALGAQAHQDLPYERLVEALAARHTGGTPAGLFEVLFNHQSQVADITAVTTASGLRLVRQEAARISARFDLSLDTHERGGELFAHFTYAKDVLDAATVERLGQDWLSILHQMTAGQGRAIGDWNLRAHTERAPGRVVDGLAVHRQFERAAATAPHTLAVVAGGERVDYLTLNRRADALALELRRQGAAADAPVALVAERSVDMLVGLLAILKAGAAYLPLEPEQPAERLAHMLQVAQVRLLLAPPHWQAPLPAGIARVEIGQTLAEHPFEGPDVHLDQLAYVIFTSGTTGRPKGVGVSHRALAHYLDAVSARLPLEGVERLAMVSTPAADLGHTMLFGALANGRTLHLLSKDHVLDAQAFAAYMSAERIDALKIVPSHLLTLLSASEGNQALPARCLVLGGEACPQALLAQIAKRAPALAVINHYGPTETTVGVLTHSLSTDGAVALGQPLGQTCVRVLDASLQPVARGELYVAGPSVARGYQGAAAQTAERFVPDPFDPQGGRLYRTGDWVLRDAIGDLHYQGRQDGQVKIRGHRVELAEVQARLCNLPGVSTAVVRVHRDGLLAAYVVAPQVDEANLRSRLASELPEPMLPSHWILLDRLPVTANGKVDVQALPDPQPLVSGAPWQAPRTPLEIAMAALWAEVLQVERVGLADNFFALGGHSLLATQLISRVRRQLSLDVALRALFDAPELGAFCAIAAARSEQAEAPIARRDRVQALPLSHAQQRQWLFWKIHPTSAAYHTPLAVRLNGALDLPALQATLDALLERHETLRSVFEEHDGTALQRVLPASGLPIADDDWRGRDQAGLEAYLRECVEAPFDLRHGPLIRARLVRLGEAEHVLLLTLHHIVSDGWSMGVMVRECLARYNAHRNGSPLVIEPLAVQYADYASWQRERLASGRQQAQIDYWKARLEDDFSVLELPADRLRPNVPSHRGARLDIRLPEQLTERLRALAVSANATLFHVFLATFALLLARSSGREKINLGVPMTNRDRVELEGLIGFFVNTVVVRTAVDPSRSFLDLLAQVRDSALGAQAHNDLPFDALVEALQPQRSTSYNPLFQVMYNHLRDVGHKVDGNSAAGLSVTELELSEHTAQFDLSLNTLERSDGLLASFNYATDLFDALRIERFAGQWQQLLHALAEQPSCAVGDLPLLPSVQRQAWVRQWTVQQWLDDGAERIHQRIARQARLTPEAIAVSAAGQQLTYLELNERANRLAHRLIASGAGPERLVGVALDRGPLVPVALLAVLKAGAAYVPLDPAFPAQRLEHMLKDSGLRLLLAEPGSRDAVQVPAGVEVLMLDEQMPWFESFSSADPDVQVHASNLAYVMYTSGSTGLPKGVAIAHDALLNFVWSMAERPGIDAQSNVLSLTSLSFDIAGLEIYTPLLKGGRVVCLRPGEQRDAQALLAVIDEQRVNVIQATPSSWKMLAVQARPGELAGKTLLCGGEALEPELAQWLVAQGGKVWNLYGPTETTIWSARQQVFAGAPVSLGQPIANTALRVQEASGELLPPGIAGELTIGGEGLARGYFQRPGLTGERFVPDPLGNGERLYRTGDLARYEDDTTLSYLGRLDHQVKIRGLRIELGEIEVRLRQIPAVCEAVVAAVEGAAGKQLVAYLQWDAYAAALQTPALKAHLRNELPTHMIPQQFIVMTQWPLTPNGKLDRKALPVPDLIDDSVAYQPAQTEVEVRLASLWAQALGVPRVGLSDNFFDLGGHSLLATQVNAQAQAEYAIDLPLIELFQAPTLAAYAQSVAARIPGGTQDLDELRDFLTDLETV